MPIGTMSALYLSVWSYCYLRLCFHQAWLTGRGITFSARPFVRPSIRLLPNLWTHYFDNEWTDFDASWYKRSTPRGVRPRNGQLWGQEVKSQGHRRRKIDLEAWWSHYSRPRCFLNKYIHYVSVQETNYSEAYYFCTFVTSKLSLSSILWMAFSVLYAVQLISELYESVWNCACNQPTEDQFRT